MAEHALCVAAGIAEKTGAKLTLLHVLERRPPSRVHRQRHLRGSTEAEEYLRELAGKLLPAGMGVSWHVHPEPTRITAASLGDHASEFGADLVVMCAHGEVRLRDRLVGNVGQQLAARRAVPVLLLRTGKGQEAIFPFRRMLIPLDGLAEHEAGLAPAAALAGICGASVELLTVVSTLVSDRRGESPSQTYLPGTTRLILDIHQQQAADYLQAQLHRLSEGGLAASAQIAKGKPASVIASVARKSGTDIVVLATHGRAGTNAFWAGSLPPQLLRRLNTAFLLVPARELL